MKTGGLGSLPLAFKAFQEDRLNSSVAPGPWVQLRGEGMSIPSSFAPLCPNTSQMWVSSSSLLLALQIHSAHC